jgi:HlyD family secretion protein
LLPAGFKNVLNQEKKRSWLVWAIGLILGVLVLAAFMSMRKDPLTVRFAKAERGEIRSVVSTNGKVEPIQNFESHAPAATTIRKIFVKEGDHVKKGQLLMQLDDADARAQAARALAQLKAAQSDISAVERGGSQEEALTLQNQKIKAQAEKDAAQRNLDALRRLQQKGAAAAGEVNAAENALQRAEADLKLIEQKQTARYSQPEVAKVQAQSGEAQAAYAAAQDMLSKSTIRAPFSGVVFAIPVRQGAYVNPGDLLLQEADLSQVLVRAFVDEPDVGRLERGQPIELAWDAVPGRIWHGSINTVPAAVKLLGTRNVGETTCIVDNADGRLLPNVNVSVTIVTTEQHNVLIIPREALRMDNGKPYVYTLVDGELRKRWINTSLSNMTSVEVTSGLDAGSLVALNAVNSWPLREGLKAKVAQ